MKTIAEMTAEIRQVNVAKGWRLAEGGPGKNTWGDYIALLHSEVSEALEAYRDHRLADATEACTSEGGEGGCDIHGHVPFKPEGVGSELADMLIRLLDTADVFGIRISGYELMTDVHDHYPVQDIPLDSFGDRMAALHLAISDAWTAKRALPLVLRTLVMVARRYGIDLDAEYERKIAYNRTRAFQHGGRTLAGQKDPSGTGKTIRTQELRKAMPDDPRDWWIGEEVDEFIGTWQRLDLPALTMQDASGEVLTLWTTDLQRAGQMLDPPVSGDIQPTMEISKGEYRVCIVQADEGRRSA